MLREGAGEKPQVPATALDQEQQSCLGAWRGTDSPAQHPASAGKPKT